MINKFYQKKITKKIESLILSSITIFILFYSSCKKDNINNINNLDKKNILKAIEVKKAEKVGVVNVDFLKFRSDNDIHSKTLRHLHKGYIVTIIEI